MPRVTPAAAPLVQTRRQWLQQTPLHWGLSWSALLAGRAAMHATPARAESTLARLPARATACIVVFYYGGPSHLDSWDPKPDAPAEVRGEFNTIATRVPGLAVSEHCPGLAQVADKVVMIRSLTHQMRLHDAACIAVHTGRPPARGDGEFFAMPDENLMFPGIGAAMRSVQGDPLGAAGHAVLPYYFQNVIRVPCQDGGFLGRGLEPLVIAGEPDSLRYKIDALALPDGLSLDRIDERAGLLAALDEANGPPRSVAPVQLRRQYDAAVDLLRNATIPAALRLEEEPAALREQYGFRKWDGATAPTTGAQNASHFALRGQNLLAARRLIEAGVPWVNVNDFKQQGQNWDAHAENFKQHKELLLPPADQALAALLTDLDERGLLDTTLVVALGEFGRTPRINANAGRDHWPDCSSVVLAGGGLKRGFVYGASDKLGAYPDQSPVTPADLAATIYAALGVDPATEIRDPLGRPFALSPGRVLWELFA